MASKFKISDKKTIIAIAIILILLIIAVTGTVVFLRDRGQTEAAELSTEEQSGQITTGNQEQTQNQEQQTEEQTTTTENQQISSEGQTENAQETTTANNGTTQTTTNAGTTAQTGIATGTTTAGGTTTTDNIQESTIIRTETEEVMVAENFLVGWRPLSIDVDEASARINAKEANIDVVKTAETNTGKNLAFAGEDITYTISVTNNSGRDLNNIEISDTVPALTTLKLINDGGIETQGKIKWEKNIKDGETVKVSFVVTVNEGATGTIRNIAIANGEESEETQTAIIKSQKTSEIKRNGTIVAEPAKVGDEITYTISLTNTGDIAGTTTVKDKDLSGILSNDKAQMVGNVAIYKGEELVSSDKTEKDLIEGINNIEVPANGEAKVVFTIKVNKIEGKITNVALIGDEGETPTEPEEIDTLDITIKKEVKEIIRNGEKVEAPVKVGDIINYNIKVKNIGSIEKEVNVSDILDNTKTSLEVKDNNQVVEKITLASGEERVLTASYTVEQSIIDAQIDIKNIAKVSYDGEEKTSDVNTPVEEKAPRIDVQKTAEKVNGEPITPETKVSAGDTITYNIVIKNTGNITLTNIDVTDDLKVNYKANEEEMGVDVEPGSTIKTIASLAPGNEEPIEVVYTVTQNDVDTKTVIMNTATATDGTTTDDDDDNTVPTDKTPGIEVQKTAEKVNGEPITSETKVSAGDTITYKIVVKNTGKITLKDIKVTDDLKVNYKADGEEMGADVEPGATIKTITSLAPGDEEPIEVVYTVTQNDVDTKTVIMNTATATDGTTTDDDDDNTIPTDKTPGIEVQKTAEKVNGEPITPETKVSAGDTITYKIVVKNTGKITLKDIKVTDDLKVNYKANEEEMGIDVEPGATIKTITSLAPGDEEPIEVVYTVTQNDVDTKTVIMNTATATDGTTTDDDDDNTVPVNHEASIDVIKEAVQIKSVNGENFVDIEKDENGNKTTFIENVGDTIKYTVTVTNTGARTLENVVVVDQNHNVKVTKITKGTNEYEATGKNPNIPAGTNLLNFLPDAENRTLEHNESYVIEMEYVVENVNNITSIENIATATASPKSSEGENVTDQDNESVPVTQITSDTITKTAVKVGNQPVTDENRENITVKEGEKITYEIVVENTGNKDLTQVRVTDDHNVTVEKIEKVNEDGTRTEDRNLKRLATQNNLLGKDVLGAGEKYVITVTYIVLDNTIDEEAENGDKIINWAFIETAEYAKQQDDDVISKYKEAQIVQSKASTVVGKDENDKTINAGDIIEYTITVTNNGNISGPTIVKDSIIRDNINNDKVLMLGLDGKTVLDKSASLETDTINVTSSKGGKTTTNINALADGYPLSVDNGETFTITFKAVVGKLLPGETISNQLDGQENTYVENDIEASITVNKTLVKPQNTVIVIDLSLSMAEAVDFHYNADTDKYKDPMASSYNNTRWCALTQALDKFLDIYMDGKNKVTIIGYNDTAKHKLIENSTSITAAKNSYATVLTRTQFDSVSDKTDVDNLAGTGTLLGSGTNIEDGLIKAINSLNRNINGAKVILMTDGEANRRMNGNVAEKCSTTEGVSAAKIQANTLTTNGATLYTVSLSLGEENETYIKELENMASEDENGKKLSCSASDMSSLVEYFEGISEILSEYHRTITTQNGILYLSDAFEIDSRYVTEVKITIPNDDEITPSYTLSWAEFSNYYNATAKTINVRKLAEARGIKGITGSVTIDISVDTTKQ